eukprot:TRINITY_DN16728_c0_g1_i2.p2 TRINITY_DN16728_c0_g1~~TRINITY_DN16728_c0_g1_i2.p2  ORF type:complete len:335 (+),score=33.07 TRINITY_DN16728_c0_g1_i2:194-1198(+)
MSDLGSPQLSPAAISLSSSIKKTKGKDLQQIAGALAIPVATYDGLTFQGHMLAGAVAGITEHAAMFPMDTIKTRMQVWSVCKDRTTTRDFKSVIMRSLRKEGILSLYRGLSAMIYGAGPSHAVYFATYEFTKQQLDTDNAGNPSPSVAAFSGAVAAAASDGCMVPADVVKQRLQISGSPYKGVLNCINTIIREEGIAGFYRSYPTTLLMNIPFTAIHFSIYETMKNAMGEGAEEESLKVQLIAGGTAGGCASAATTPLDVVKTRLQTQALVNKGTQYSAWNVFQTMRQIMVQEGIQGLWRGWKPRVLFHIPSAAICFGTYESMKSLLTWKDKKE